MLRKLFVPNIQRIERIRTIDSVLKQVFFRFRIFLCGLVFAEAIASAFHASGLNSQNQIIIVLVIEVQREPLLA